MHAYLQRHAVPAAACTFNLMHYWHCTVPKVHYYIGCNNTALHYMPAEHAKCNFHIIDAVLQDTLYYLPAEAHALGWQPEGLAQKLYAHVSAQQAPAPQRALAPQQAQQAVAPQHAQQALAPQQAQQAPALQHAQQAATPQQAQQAIFNSMSARSDKTLPGISAVTLNPSTGIKQDTANTKAVTSSTEGIKQNTRDCAVEGSRVTFQLPAPFTARPRIGSRIFVQSHFPGIAGALAAEMHSWQLDTRFRYLPAPVIGKCYCA